jgi:predicted metalloprotease with PDZ domain
MKKVIILLFIICILLLNIFNVAEVSADTVILKNNKQIKGVIVEEYADRLILSTMEGEKTVMSVDRRKIDYDLEEQNFTNLGDYYQDKRMYHKAYYYYNRALEVNPEYKKARDGLNYVGTFLQQTSRRRKLSHIQRLNIEKDWTKKSKVKEIPAEEKVKNELGIVLKNNKGTFVIEKVPGYSPAGKAGVEKGDILLYIWGRAISYMEPEEVYKKLFSDGVMDINVTIARTISLDVGDKNGKYSDLLGLKFGYDEMDGLIIEKIVPGGIAQKGGLKESDRVIGIQGESTRYLPLKDIENLIKNRKSDTIQVQVKRNIIIWKAFNKEGG